MKERYISFLLSLLFTLLFFFPSASWPQLVIGQYEDEAPFRTWNTLGIKTASSLGRGETQFTLASDCSVALSNPALLTRLPKITYTLNYSSSRALFYKYSLVNTGVLFSEESLSHDFSAFDFLGMSVRLNNWAFGLSWALIENYERPLASFEYGPQDALLYSINFDQQGKLNNLNFSISSEFFEGFSLGFGFNYVYGRLDKDLTEEWFMDGVTITDTKSSDYKGYYFNGGLTLDLTESFRVAAVIRTPYIKKSKSQSVLRYESVTGGTDISIDAASDDEFHQPLVAGLGARFIIFESVKMISEFTLYKWSDYKVDYFGEPLQRDFIDVIKIGIGAEYENSIELFNQVFYLPWRAGFSYDPQPMKEPSSSYVYITIGSGIRWKNLLFDAAFIFGQERGSGDALSVSKVAFSLSYHY